MIKQPVRLRLLTQWFRKHKHLSIRVPIPVSFWGIAGIGDLARPYSIQSEICGENDVGLLCFCSFTLGGPPPGVV